MTSTPTPCTLRRRRRTLRRRRPGRTLMPTQAVIVGEQPLFQRKLNRKGKPTGKAVLTGFALNFRVALNPSAADAARYLIDTVTTKKVKGKKVTILHPIENLAVSYLPASDTVQITLGSRARAVPDGGQLTILGGADDRLGQHADGERGVHHRQGWEEHRPAVNPSVMARNRDCMASESRSRGTALDSSLASHFSSRGSRPRVAFLTTTLLFEATDDPGPAGALFMSSSDFRRHAWTVNGSGDAPPGSEGFPLGPRSSRPARARRPARGPAVRPNCPSRRGIAR